jgi:CBS domain-containing protein
MRTISVKELMVPLEEYATVPEEATMHEAILALEKARKAFEPSQHKHHAILVLDGSKNVVGKLSMFDILIALEPKYDKLENVGGYSPDFIKSMLNNNVFWNEPLELICDRAPNLKVSDFMEVPSDGVYIDENATLGDAMHQLIVCRYHSLLVTIDKKVVGVLRLTDVFTQICNKIKACKT